MLQHTKWLLEQPYEDGRSLIAVRKERFDNPVTALNRGSNGIQTWTNNKSYNDILDAFRLMF
jgi:hypothetical protein